MDATRADLEFTAEVIQIALDEGATTINIPDTVGYAMPMEYAEFLRGLYEHVPGLHDVVLSVHCHDDLGLAVANSFAGLQAGARQVECAVNGIGERAGNASIEEIIMLLHTRRADVGLYTEAVTKEIARTSRMVSRLTGYSVQPNKAIVGRNAFAHESGHPSGRRAEGALHLRDHGRGQRRPGRRQLDRAGQALRPPRAAAGADRAGLRAERADAQHRLQALQGDRRQEEAGHGDGPRGAGHRRAALGDRRLHAAVVRRRGLLAPPAARDRRGRPAPTATSWSGRSPATVPSTRSSTRSTRPPGSTPSSASSASTPSPAARTRSARPRSCSRSPG